MDGWAISERLQQISSDALQVQQGSLYPDLHRLERRGWVKAKWAISENNRRAGVEIGIRWPTAGKLSCCGEFESLPWRKRHDANVNKTGPTKTGRSAICSLLASARRP
jgi:hypothetical protein